MLRFFNFASSANLNKILVQPNPNLEEILDEECVINEVRNGNYNLIQFICQKEIFDALLSYVTEIPNDVPYDPNESRMNEKINKYPFIATEILAIENEAIAQYFFGLTQNSKSQDVENDSPLEDPNSELADSMTIENQQFLKTKQENLNEDTQMDIEILPPIIKFLRLVNSQETINFTIAGYFAKILRTLFHFRPVQLANILFDTHFKYLQRMASHIYSDSLCDVFSLIVKLDTQYFRSEAQEYYIEKRTMLVQQLILNLFEKPSSTLGDANFIDLQTNSSNLLIHLLSNIHDVVKGQEIIIHLFEPEVLNKIINGLAEPSLISAIIPFITELCNYKGHVTFLKQDTDSRDQPTDSISQSEVFNSDVFINAIINSIDILSRLLQVENQEINPQAVPFQHGNSSFCFGKTRSQVLDLVYSYIKLQNNNINLKIINSGLIQVLLALFVKNPWSNILHSSLLKIFNFMLANGPECFFVALFEQSQILDFIINALKDSEFTIISKHAGKVTKGYTPFLYMLSNTIEESSYDYIRKSRNSHQGWQGFRNSELKEANGRNNRKLGEDDFQSSTTSFPGFPRTIIYNGEIPEPQTHQFERDLNEAHYEEPEDEEIKLDSEVPVVQPEEELEIKDEIGFVSPTHNSEFRDSDIRERQEHEVILPHSVNVKTGFKNDYETANHASMNRSMVEDEMTNVESHREDANGTLNSE